MTTGYAEIAATPLGGTPSVESAAEALSDEQLLAMLVDRARNDGLQLTGEGEITDHVGYGKRDAANWNGATAAPRRC
ncbi:hypothetical protein ACFYZB_34345 [Streptomyces sp. NPDC001852]|uniref:hypothetical protein n=1 Tax=Streptomyces sp. NPDC001852 TaxID=3364619 RepID=UPI00367B00CB